MSAKQSLLPDSLPAFLRERAGHNTRNFLRQIEDVGEEEAGLNRAPDWPTHRWGIGQDGSIAGIVTHVAAWKAMTLPLLTPGGQAIDFETFSRDAAPSVSDWQGLRQWYADISAAWLAVLEALPDATFAQTNTWAGQTWAIGLIVAEIVEHDVQHASQIEYLRQQCRAQGILVPHTGQSG